ncbi:MAG: GspE/PulE family protein [Pseudomonadota bacterium]
MKLITPEAFDSAYQVAFHHIRLEDALVRGILPVLHQDGTVAVVMPTPCPPALDAWVEQRTAPHVVERLLAPPDFIASRLQRIDQSQRPDTAWTEAPGAPPSALDTTPDISLQSLQADTHPVVKSVNAILLDAFRLKASDIHFENNEEALAVKYRLDGVLTPVSSFARTLYAGQVISRIKVLANLDISERRIPQDGRFRARLDGRDIDFRVSIMPGLHGEDAVLRILDKQHITGEFQQLRLESLGFSATDCEQLRPLSRLPYGMFLVTGPTGSGKTTTLYALLSELQTGAAKTVSIEDPVEYQLPGILQIPVNEKKGLNFATGLRSILRHDPDRIMVGEIRDAETAEIAIQAALTGHAVFTTLHANTVFDVVNRFRHMGVDLHGFVSALNAVMAQRLVRKICSDCRTSLEAPASAPVPYKGHTLFHGKGCATCRFTGYQGRKAINELLVMSDALREEIVAGAPVSKIKKLARAQGTLPLYDSAWAAVLQGITTVEEAERVTFFQA